jgi:hypothetical protein
MPASSDEAHPTMTAFAILAMDLIDEDEVAWRISVN